MNLNKLVWLAGIVLCVAFTGAIAAPNAKLIEFWDDHEPESRMNIDHAKWDDLLKKHVNTEHPSGINRLDYAGFSNADQASLVEYLEYLQQMDPRQVTRNNQKAFWLNLYNATIVSLVLEKGVDDSIKELGRIWKKKRFYIAMQDMSLDSIQHGILRPMFGDKRLLLAIHAGTLGSASIQPAAYTALNVDQLLDTVVTDFLAHRNGLEIDGDKLTLSSTFKWYASDFGNRRALFEFLSQYVADDKIAALQQVNSVKYQYDWTLNKP